MPEAPDLIEDDFLAALQAYLPRGFAWPRDPDAVLTQFLAGTAKAQARLHARENALLVDVFPATTLELLPEWEFSLGLPDKCIGPAPTIEERRALVMARLTAQGGASIAYFIAIALALGYVITISEFPAGTFGLPFGLPMLADRWVHAWQVDTDALRRTRFKFGTAFGRPFSEWTEAAVLRCEFERLQPAHTIIIFAYQEVDAL